MTIARTNRDRAEGLVRWGAFSALAGGMAWIGLGLESIVRPDPQDYRDALMLIPWTLSMGAIMGLHARQYRTAGPLGHVGAWLTLTAMAATFIATFGLIWDIDTFTWLAFPVGPLAWVAGMLLLGVATVRARVVAPWCGYALALAEPMTIAVAVALSPLVPLADEGNYSGAVANGVAFLLVGLALRARFAGTVTTSSDRMAEGAA